MKVAVLGVGHLMHHVVPGMLKSDNPALEIRLSARSQARAQDLAERFGLQIVDDNQTLVDWAEIVVIAVRPFDMKPVLKSLSFRKGQILLSFAATVPLVRLQSAAPQATAVLGMPNVAAEFGDSTTVIYPAQAAVETLMAPCGTVIAVETEAEYETASLFGAYYGWIQALSADMALWAQDQGLNAEVSRNLIAGVTRSSATRMLNDTNTSVEQLVEDLSLPGSLTGDGVQVLKSEQAFDPWRKAATKILGRIKGSGKV